MNKDRTEEDMLGEDRRDLGNNTDEDTGEDTDNSVSDYIH